MSLGELETLVRSRLPFLVVVDNDAAYGAEVHLLRYVGLPSDHALFPDLDLAGIARALGAQGITVRDLTDLERLRPWLDQPHGTMVVDCKVDPHLGGAWLDEAFGAGGWYQRMANP